MSAGSASAPGSSANLGPGFDVLAIAWEIRCRARVSRADAWLISQDGDSYTPPDGGFVKRAAQAGGAGPFHIEIENDIPRSRGLGSSAAVAAAVAAAAFRAGGAEPSDHELFTIVTGLDGHADNAAAAVYGGLVMVDGQHYARLDVSPQLRFLAAIPDAPLRTAHARAALPDHVSRPAVVRSMARFGFLLRGLQSGDADLLSRARGDEIHEAPRAALSPTTGALIAGALAAGALHACWSGAGPSALAITAVETVEAVTAAMEKVLDGAGRVQQLSIAGEGWR